MLPGNFLESDRQKAAVCRILCESALLPGMWTDDDGPTQGAHDILEQNCSGLSADQEAVFLAAWIIWGDRKPPARQCYLPFQAILSSLSGTKLWPLASFLVAASKGGPAVNRWIADNDKGGNAALLSSWGRSAVQIRDWRQEMFPDHLIDSEQNKAAICRILCDAASLPGMWTDAYGPTQRARDILQQNCPELPYGQKTAFLAAWMIWNDSKPPAFRCELSFSSILNGLSGRYLMPLASLLVAMSQGRNAIKEWIIDNDKGQMPRL